MSLHNVKALLFDTFGPVVDCRRQATLLGERLAAQNGMQGVRWYAFPRRGRAAMRNG